MKLADRAMPKAHGSLVTNWAAMGVGFSGEIETALASKFLMKSASGAYG